MKSLLIKLTIERWNDSSKDDVIEGEEGKFKIHSLLLNKINRRA